MNDNERKVLQCLIYGVVCLLLGLSALWQWTAVHMLTEQIRAGYVEETYARELGTRWVKPSRNQ